MRVAVLTVSDGCYQGDREDRSGELLARWCEERQLELVARDVVPDETASIVPRLTEWADSGEVDVILTTGGTGLAPRDVTPEATQAVLEREAPGIADAIRRRGESKTPYAVLSRGVVGTRGSVLIANLPGSPGGVRDGLEVLGGLLLHAHELLTGVPTDHRLPGSGHRS